MPLCNGSDLVVYTSVNGLVIYCVVEFLDLRCSGLSGPLPEYICNMSSLVEVEVDSSITCPAVCLDVCSIDTYASCI